MCISALVELGEKCRYEDFIAPSSASRDLLWSFRERLLGSGPICMIFDLWYTDCVFSRSDIARDLLRDESKFGLQTEQQFSPKASADQESPRTEWTRVAHAFMSAAGR